MPGQSVDEPEAVMLTVGVGVTFIVADVVPRQPVPLPTVTLYPVFAVGETIIDEVVAPVFQE